VYVVLLVRMVSVSLYHCVSVLGGVRDGHAYGAFTLYFGTGLATHETGDWEM
jgi:hypothetical protein